MSEDDRRSPAQQPPAPGQPAPPVNQPQHGQPPQYPQAGFGQHPCPSPPGYPNTPVPPPRRNRTKLTAAVTAAVVVITIPAIWVGIKATQGNDTPHQATKDPTPAGGTTGGSGSGEVANLTLWFPKGSVPAESAALDEAVRGFNEMQSATKVTVRYIPPPDYSAQVDQTSAGELPDILAVDGVEVATRVRQKKLIDLSTLLDPQKTLANLTDSIKSQGTIDGKLYAVGQFNSAVGVYANKKLLDAAGVKYPTMLAGAWTAEEFTAAVKTLAAKNTVLPGKSLDLKLNYGEGGLGEGEWPAYAFMPLVWSAGGDVLQNGKATGALNSDATIKAFETVASWKSYVTPNTHDTDFAGGKVALSYVGNWAYPGYSKALGKDLLALPLPNFGKGAKTSTGSPAWGITPNSKHPKAAAAFLDYLMNDQNVAAVVADRMAAPGAPPATLTAFKASKIWTAGGSLALWGEALTAAPSTPCVSGTALPATCVAINRPLTAGYPTVTKQFREALDKVFKGAPAKATLDAAAQAIDTDFTKHGGYR